jgi:hypothetical protein
VADFTGIRMQADERFGVSHSFHHADFVLHEMKKCISGNKPHQGYDVEPPSRNGEPFDLRSTA